LPASGDRTCSYERIIKRVSLSICSAGFLLFYAIPYFEMSLSHGPSDLVLGSFLVVLAALPTQNLSDRGWYLLACCFGAFVAYFEFLTGGLPLGCALLIASAAVCPRASDNTGALWRRAVAMVFYFLSTAAFCFAFKVALVSLTIEQSAFLHFLRDLTRKMSGEVGGWLYELEVLVQFSGMMLFGWRFSAEALLAVSLLTIGSWMYYAIVHVRDRVLQTRQSLLLASVGVIALWFGLFREHTIVHAFFMVRLLAWIPIVGATMFGLTLIHVRARATIGA
jgi:hypothetical protein